MISVVRATHAHVGAILPRLRAQERKTIEKLGIDPSVLLRATINKGMPSFAALVDGEVGCMWGLDGKTFVSAPLQLWMLTTPLVEKHFVSFLRISRGFVRWSFHHYGPIEGLVDAEFDQSERWLRWIGFKMVEDGPYRKMRYE